MKDEKESIWQRAVRRESEMRGNRAAKAQNWKGACGDRGRKRDGVGIQRARRKWGRVQHYGNQIIDRKGFTLSPKNNESFKQ